nr:MAG TPA: hypothetical protein [Caudoviricetes sp.]
MKIKRKSSKLNANSCYYTAISKSKWAKSEHYALSLGTPYGNHGKKSG